MTNQRTTADPPLPAPLASVRVLDLSRVMAGPFCAQLLGDFGAEVIKVERPVRGDEAREFGPPFLKRPDGSNTGETPMFISANRNKKSVTVNLASSEGQEIVRRLAAKSDVLIENYKVGDLSRYGLAYNDLRKVNPNLIYCSVTGFGQTGPSRHRLGYDSIFQAMGGLMGATGYPEDQPGGGPVKSGIVAADIIGGLFATIGVLGALLSRGDRRDGGQHIDIALLDGVVAAMSHLATNYLVSGTVPKLRGTLGSGGMPSKMYSCRDGQVMIVAGNDEQFRRMCGVLGCPELGSDPRFHKNSLRVQNGRELIQLLETVIAEWSAAELAKALEEAQVPAALVNNLQQVFEEPQVQARELLTSAPHPSGTDTPLLRNPIRFSRTEEPNYVAPPTLGQHTREILQDLLGYTGAEVDAMAASGII